jgi:hypothetical protein
MGLDASLLEMPMGIAILATPTTMFVTSGGKRHGLCGQFMG